MTSHDPFYLILQEEVISQNYTQTDTEPAAGHLNAGVFLQTMDVAEFLLDFLHRYLKLHSGI